MPDPVKIIVAARRREGVTHERLVGFWCDPHAVGFAAHVRPDAYALSFFDQRRGSEPFDGMAAFRIDDPVRAVRRRRDIPPVVAADGWADLVELPTAWLPVTEHAIVTPPSTAARHSAYKLTFFVSARPGADVGEIHRHWLEVHASNVRNRFEACGGVRYVINLVDPAAGSPFVGVAELSYVDKAAARSHVIDEDGFDDRTTGFALSGREVVIAG